MPDTAIDRTKPAPSKKRLVICADGTWNLRDQVDKRSGKRRPTNVTKVARAIRPRSIADDMHQVVIYHEGVGTNGGLDKLTGGAFGKGIEENVRSLYRSIAYNYVEGDELYLFGFSRGAFTVRTLVGFMSELGVLQKDDDYWLPELYDLYQKNSRHDSPEWKAVLAKLDYEPRPCPTVTFMGVWDTVGALGAPNLLGRFFNRKKYQYHETGLVPAIEYAYQALAIDERRSDFRPVIWSKPEKWDGTLEQAWFPGVHCDVGGSESPDGLANEALQWIVGKAKALGLDFDDFYLGFYWPCFNSVKHESMSALYGFLGEYRREIGVTRDSHEHIHQSAIDRCRYGPAMYDPANLRRVLASHPPFPVANTTWGIPRGNPCGPIPKPPSSLMPPPPPGYRRRGLPDQ